jgi:S1-C subfamily serine protease
MFEDIGTAVRTVTAALRSSVVAIGRDGRGTGFVVAPGKVLTNAHNLRDRTTTVAFADGRAVQGEVVAGDGDGDLVVLAVDTADAPAVTWGEPPTEAGVPVVGVSAGGGRFRATVGFTTTVDTAFRGPRGRRLAGAVEHTAPLPRGSSGGPLADVEGRVVGIDTHRSGAGFYLARPADPALRARVDELVAGRSTPRRTLGVALAPAPVAARLRASVGLPARDGLLVRAVVDGSPAAAAGLRQGDLLVAAGDRALRTPDDLHEALEALTGDGASLVLTVVRGVDESTTTVSWPAASGPAPEAAAGSPGSGS